MFHFFARVLFLTGILIGILLAIVLTKVKEKKNGAFDISIKKLQVNNSIYELWFSKNNFVRKKVPIDVIRYSGDSFITESKFLFKKIKVLCLIIVRNIKNAKAAEDTWAKSCNYVKYVNITLTNKKKIVPIKKTKENSSWVLLCRELRDVTNKINWVLIVNDDTFALVENLRLLVGGLDHLKNYYLGHAIMFWSVMYNMGQAGYALSRGAVQALQNKLNFTYSCTSEATYWNQEDMYLGKHLASLNITPVDTRDSSGLSRFHPYNWQRVFFPEYGHYKHSVFPVRCCSPHSITFQAIDEHKFYMYYYILYQLQIFNYGNFGNRAASTPMPEYEVWQGFLRKKGVKDMNISASAYFELWRKHIYEQYLRGEVKKEDYLNY